MARIAGVKVIKDSKGRPKQVLIDIKKHGEYLEDFLDHLDVEARRDEGNVAWESVVSRLDKKHQITTPKKK